MNIALARIGIVVGAFFAFLALLPFSGNDTKPSQSFSVFGNGVPAGTDGASPWLAIAVGVATLVAGELVLRRALRHRRTNAVRHDAFVPGSVDELLALLDLEKIEVGLFRGRQPRTSLQRVFGGQVAGQALMAATRTTDDDRRRTLAALVLPPRRRPGRADRVRRRADPRRAVVQHPAGGRPSARPTDLLPVRLVPGGRGRLRAPGSGSRRAPA